MVIFHSYVSLPEGNPVKAHGKPTAFIGSEANVVLILDRRGGILASAVNYPIILPSLSH
jgi:hypothetical protein